MKKSIMKRMTTAVVTVTMVVSSMLTGASAQTTVSGRGAMNATAINVCTVASVGTGANEAGLKKAAEKDYSKLLYGNDTNEYYLGTAAHFAVFAKTAKFAGNADCEGRIAADELVIENCPNGGYPVVGYQASSGESNKGIGGATVICNNSASKNFGNLNPFVGNGGHTYVVSEEVSSILAPAYADWMKDGIRQNTLTVPTNALINFDAEFAALTAKSRELATMSNGTVTNSYGNVTLKGTDAKANFFMLSESLWNSTNSLNIVVPNGSYVVINVAGKNVSFGNAFANCLSINGRQLSQSSSDNQRVLFNFYEATSVKLVAPNRGAVLAPQAYVEDVCAYQHDAAQIIAKQLYVKNEVGYYGFTMPKSYVSKKTEEVTKKAYTVHYMYYTADGKMKELPAELYEAFISAKAAPMPANAKIDAAYQNGDSVKAADQARMNKILSLLEKDADLKLYAQMLKNDCELRFEVYEDGKDWTRAVDGSKLTEAATLAGMNRKADIGLSDSYSFDDSNVYFVMYPMAKVKVDVSWDDKHDKSGKRPGDFSVALVEKYNTTDDTKAEAELLSGKSFEKTLKDVTLNKDIVYDVYEDAYTFYVPLLGSQADENGKLTGRTYNGLLESFGENGLFDIAYDIPEEYKDVTVTRVDKAEGAPIVDENGVAANFHIVFRGEYKAVFYVVDENGLRTEVYKNNFFDADADDYRMYLGLSTTGALPTLNSEEREDILGLTASNNEYTVIWRDVATGKTYRAGDRYAIYSFDYEDVVFETIIRRTESLRDIPWYYVNLITYNGSHFVPGKMAWQRMKMDGTQNPDEFGFNFIQKADGSTAYSYEALQSGEYANDKFLLFSFAYGVDKERAAYTRVTVSKEGYSYEDEVLYECKLAKSDAASKGILDTYRSIKSSTLYTVKTLLPNDPYAADYDGMRYFRLALPAEEYADETLYFTVYYIDANGQESIWVYGKLNMAQNKYWTIQR